MAMRTIEVDEATLAKNQQLVGLINKMLAHPEARKKVMAAHKDVDPTVVIPEIDAAKPLDDAMAAITKRMDDFMADQEKRAKDREDAERKATFVTNFEKGRAGLRAAGVTDEGITAVEALMEKHGIIDHEIGWAAFSKLNPEPTPLPPAPNFGFNGLFDSSDKNPDEFLKAMHASRGLDEAALDRRIHEVITETRQQYGAPQQRSGFGR